MVALALKKQRLQFRSAALRHELAQDCSAFVPVFETADKVRAGAAWLRAHPQILAGIAVVLLVARPKAALRWGRRGFFAWQTWRRLRDSREKA
jgi:hypothetical protein